MLYSAEITVTANTLAASPKEQVLKVTKGAITEIGVNGRWGQRGYVKVRILHAENAILPLSRDAWIVASGMPKTFREYYEIKTAPTELKIQVHSAGSAYDHNVNVDVTVLDPKVASVLRLVQLLEAFFKRIGLTVR